MDFEAEWATVLDGLGGEDEIRQMAKEQGFLGWRQGIIQPLIGYDELWMETPEIVGLGLLVPNAILCMSRDLEDFERAENLGIEYLQGFDSLSELLLGERKALLALDDDIVEAEEVGWIEILTQVRLEMRPSNVENFKLKDALDEGFSELTQFVEKVHQMLREVQQKPRKPFNNAMEFNDDFQEEWT